MEKGKISWFLTIWLFLPRLAFFLNIDHGLAFFLKKMIGNPVLSNDGFKVMAYAKYSV